VICQVVFLCFILYNHWKDSVNNGFFGENMKNVKKGCLLLCLACFFVARGFAQTSRTFTIEIANVVVNNGNVFLAIFANADEFRREEPSVVFILPSAGTTVSQEVTLPYGDYLITAFQDANGNNNMDFNILGIPKEILGMSNWNGRGFPSRNFDRQKIPINGTTGKITIGLFSIF
jgi:uncharacterized protein (DUF2141 family)